MKNKLYSYIAIALSSMLLLAFINLDTTATGNNLLYAGTAKIDFTPSSIPDSMVRDHQFIRVIAFSDGKNKALIIAHENISTRDALWNEMSQRIQKETGIPPEYIMICAVHNHSGINTGDDFNDKMMACVKEALANMKPVSIGAGKGECRMSMNRRAKAVTGGIYLGKNPYGPCDYEVAVLKVNNEKGESVTMMVNWPCHAVINFPESPLYTGDWPGGTSKFVENNHENKIIVPVTIGASADINPIYRWSPTDIQPSADGKQEPIDVTAMDLGLEVERVANGIITHPGGKITAVQRYLTLPGKQQLESVMERYEARRPNQKITPAGDLRVRLTAIKVGNIIFTGFGGEVMTEIGIELKQKSPYANNFVITHCNGSAGYLVTNEALKEGGLEAARMLGMPGTAKVLIDNMLEMINELE